ncbi:hypothetical protein HCA89_00245 [Listeria innocua]|uniref:Uncharacterized protein n=1 Tax=Listeria innocua TaxID=1642 RepID=A0AB73H7B9_LISIO|nr:hypothetical protein [Listeria innocua]EAD6937633.1 hypothetical protein [Listeria monocytogenes]EAG1721835.1 hypothetical protein [Listeria monocytogenes]EHW6680178.1 hypothetical protein [Listeria monocytogenes]MBC1377873.1 hypothetical protein [Listeria innocua]MBC2140722.1 hypothetical protein [Listeria innocua]
MDFSHIVDIKETNCLKTAKNYLKLGYLLINVCSRTLDSSDEDNIYTDIFYIFGLTEEQYEVL